MFRFLILLLLLHKSAFGNPALSAKADFVDSLLKEGQWYAAEREINSITHSLSKNNNKNPKAIDLRLNLQQAMIFIHNNEDRRALEILLDGIEDAERMELHMVLYLSHIYLSLVYEKNNVMNLCREHLDYAQTIFQKNKYWAFYSTFCVRSASYYRLIKKKDSTSYFTEEAMKFATLYNHKKDLADANILAGITQPENAIEHFSKSAGLYLQMENFSTAAFMYLNIARVHLRKSNISNAFHYADSAFSIANRLKGDSVYINNVTHENSKDHILVSVYNIRYQAYRAFGNVDSMILYMHRYYELDRKLLIEKDEAEIREMTEQYKGKQKEVIIKNKNQQLVFATILLSIVTITIILVVRKNRKINDQNKIIGGQMQELQKALAQKKVLLSELQHRVKNNLQHVLGVLELQRESADFNNVDELIRENKNRVQSMALLHSKLDTSDSLQYVNPEQYISDLANLVRNSYDVKERIITINLRCNIASLNINQAFSLGLIIVELISNSMKYAFMKHAEGSISIALLTDEHSGRNKLYYADNGIGFDFFAPSPKGLGLEIIKGLISQLDGKVEARSKKGFELKVYF